MGLPESGKLVRDKIPEIIRQAGQHPVCGTIGPDQVGEALRLKICEEANELSNSSDESLAEEIADVYEVLRALVLSIGLEWKDIENIALMKREERGGFVHGTWLFGTEG